MLNLIPTIMVLSGALAAGQPADESARMTEPDAPVRAQEQAYAGVAAESPLLTEHAQLTSRDRFVKAGEAYFDHESPPRWIIFQAVPVPEEGKEPLPYYAMYVAKLRYEGSGQTPRIVGIEEPVEISPPGSANTCGWFHPTERGVVFYGSTMEPPSEPNSPGYQRGTSRYRWEFAQEMRIVRQIPRAIHLDLHPQDHETAVCGTTFMPQPILGDGTGYIAEGSISPDGRTLLYAKMIDGDARDLDLFVMDLESGRERRIVQAAGYDGGPFFSPDGKSICYRSDRRGNSELQLFVARLTFDERGEVVGSADERALTDNPHVNWAPFWHPSGKYLVYGTSEIGHRNYEIFAVEVDWKKPPASLRKRRVTHAEGADVLPVFNDDGRWMMWTAQRGPTIEGETRPSSQVWVARVNTKLASDVDVLFGESGSGAHDDGPR